MRLNIPAFKSRKSDWEDGSAHLCPLRTEEGAAVARSQAGPQEDQPHRRKVSHMASHPLQRLQSPRWRFDGARQPPVRDVLGLYLPCGR